MARTQLETRTSPQARSRFAVAPVVVGVAAVLGVLALVLPLAAFADATRGVTFAATLAAVGLCVFGRAVHDRGGTPEEELALRRAVLFTVLAGVVASFAGLALEVADVSGRGLAGVTDTTSWRIVVENGTYASVAARVLGLAFLAYVAAARWHGPTAWPLVIFGGALACAWSMLTGHPATHGPQGLICAVVCVHMAAASVWFGGLIGLGLSMSCRRRTDDLQGGAAVVRRFSRLMTINVAALLTAGAIMSWFFLDGIGRLTTTTYGLVLLAKISLAIAVIAVAAFNNRRLVPAVQNAHGSGWRMLARTVAIEQGALVAVLAITAVLVSLDPHS